MVDLNFVCLMVSILLVIQINSGSVNKLQVLLNVCSELLSDDCLSVWIFSKKPMWIG